jgi:tRNA nucleotidyltransferase (CCA-adding enzyme)
MQRRGFRPVGKDFPVFLHPDTQEEYALARTERKTAPGYHGFVFHAAPDVTLEDDLVRRDLTINAMARAADGTIVDPFGGQRDLRERVFRHVSDAFAEDPVRVLRVARFAARFPEFRVAGTTNALMRQMADAGEVDALVPERVWQEIARGLMEARPSRMLEVLRDAGALARIMPELDALWSAQQERPGESVGAHVALALDQAALRGFSLPVRFALMLHDVGRALAPAGEAYEERGAAAVEALCKRYRVPADCRDLAVLTARYHNVAHRAQDLDAEQIVRLLKEVDAFRRPQRFDEFLQACEADTRGHLQSGETPYPQAQRLRRALAAALAVDAGAIAAGAGQKALIPARIHAARVDAVKQALPG